MSDYIYTNDGLVNADDLMHYGVPGMRWGHRKNRYAGVSTDGSKRRAAEKARQDMIAAKRNKRVKGKEYRKVWDSAYNYSSLHPISQWRGKNKKESDKRWSRAEKKGQESLAADKQYKATKKAYKAAKKMANLEAKAVKEKYKNEYMKGASVAGKIYAKLTGSHKYYADMMYGINNGAYKSPNATSRLAKKVSDAEAKAAAQKRLDRIKSRTTKR